ncbi:MAG: hypothetical protein ACT4OK_13845 [Gemmobacter sp.]
MKVAVSLSENLLRVEDLCQNGDFDSALVLCNGLLRAFKELPNSESHLFEIRKILVSCMPGVKAYLNADHRDHDAYYDYFEQLRQLERVYLLRGMRDDAVDLWDTVASTFQGATAIMAVERMMALIAAPLPEGIVSRLYETYVENFGMISATNPELEEIFEQFIDFLCRPEFGKELPVETIQEFLEWLGDEGLDELSVRMVHRFLERNTFGIQEGVFAKTLGFAYFSIGNFDKAAEKFFGWLLSCEIDFQAYPALWVAKSCIELEKIATARVFLREVLRTSKPEDEEFAEASMLLVQIASQTTTNDIAQ